MSFRATPIRSAICCFLGVVFINLILIGCVSTTVNATQLKPAEVNMAGYEQVAIGEVESPSAPFASKPLRERLISMIQGTGIYRVVDREMLSHGLREVEVQQALGVDTVSTSDFIKPTILLTAFIDRLSFNSAVEESALANADGTTYPVYRRNASAELLITVKLLDLSTMELVSSTPLRAAQAFSTEWLTTTPPEISPGPMYETMYIDVANQFMRKIAPYTVPVVVDLYTVGPSALNEGGIRAFKNREYELAESSFLQAHQVLLDNPKTNPKKLGYSLHNVAVASEFQGKYAEAMVLADEALSYYQSTKTLGLKARLRQRIADQARFDEQGLSAGQVTNQY